MTNWFRKKQMNPLSSRGIERELRLLRERFDYLQEKVQMNIDELRAAVAENSTVVQSAVVAINGLADKLQAAINNTSWDGVQDIVDTMRNDDAALAKAIAANTATPPEPEPEPVAPVVEPQE